MGVTGYWVVALTGGKIGRMRIREKFKKYSTVEEIL